MITTIPIQWLYVQAAGHVSSLAPHLDLYDAFDRGEDGSASLYADHLRRQGLDEKGVAYALARRSGYHAAGLPEGPLPVALTARGRYELLDGHHRAARYVHEGRSEVPVEVLHVSPTWETMEADLRAIYPGQPHLLYQEIEHPWFAGWSTARGPARVAAIVEAARAHAPQGSALDIGCCSGRIARELARAGWRTFGVDLDHRIVRVAETLNGVWPEAAVTYLPTAEYRVLLDHGPRWALVIWCSVAHRRAVAGEREAIGAELRHILDRAACVITDAEYEGVEIDGHRAPSAEEHEKWLHMAQVRADSAGIASSTHIIERLNIPEERPTWILRPV